MSTLGASVISKVYDFRYPAVGSWRADVQLQSGDLPSGVVTLTIGDLVLQGGKVKRADMDAGDRARVVLVGGLGWHSLVTAPISFQSDGGVRLSTVLGQIARQAGQTIEKPPDNTIGNYYECIASRPGEPVRWMDVLADLAQDGHVKAWRVDPDGVTRFGARAAREVTARATVLSKDSAAGMITYGLDNPATFLPGNTIEGRPIHSLELRETSGKLEADVYTTQPQATPDIREQVRRMVANAFRATLRTYVVAQLHGDGRLDLVPPPDAQHLPEMKNVEQWCMGGLKFKAEAGDEVLVAFRDERKARPVAFAFKMSTKTFHPVARSGDAVHVLLPPATFTGVIGGSPATGVLTFTTGSTEGTIEAGSSQVESI